MEKNSSDEREFYSIVDRKICMRLPLPEAKGKKCIEVRFGWLLTHSSSSEVTLFNPWSRAEIELPNFTTFPEFENCEMNPAYATITRAVLSANPSDAETSNSFALLVIANQFMGFWRPGDKNWTRIESEITHDNVNKHSITYYNHKFYALNCLGKVWAWDPSSGTDELILTTGGRAGRISTIDNRVVYLSALHAYLVVSSDGLDLLCIGRNGRDSTRDRDYGVSNFWVFGIDVMKREWKPLSCLPDEDAIFVGENAPISVRASASAGIKPNCISYSLDEDDEGSRGGGKDMGVYSITDRSTERFDVTSLSFVFPAIEQVSKIAAST